MTYSTFLGIHDGIEHGVLWGLVSATVIFGYIAIALWLEARQERRKRERSGR